MMTAVYPYWAGAKAATVATRATELTACAILAVLFVASVALIGWAVSAAVQGLRRLEKGDQGLPLLSPGAWGEPDVDPPSTSPEAVAEVAELEALWQLSGRRRPASSD
jgi:hypothetical protein